jgi:hypothetical protein
LNHEKPAKLDYPEDQHEEQRRDKRKFYNRRTAAILPPRTTRTTPPTRRARHICRIISRFVAFCPISNFRRSPSGASGNYHHGSPKSNELLRHRVGHPPYRNGGRIGLASTNSWPSRFEKGITQAHCGNDLRGDWILEPMVPSQTMRV